MTAEKAYISLHVFATGNLLFRTCQSMAAGNRGKKRATTMEAKTAGWPGVAAVVIANPGQDSVVFVRFSLPKTSRK